MKYAKQRFKSKLLSSSGSRGDKNSLLL